MLYETMKRPTPFKLSIANLQPEFFEVTGLSVVYPDKRRHRRNPYRPKRLRRMQRWLSGLTPETAHGQIHYSSRMTTPQKPDSSPSPLTDLLMSDGTTHATWYGPTVRIRRDGMSFTGDAFEIGLLSHSGELLVPKLRVPVDIVATKPANDAQITDNHPTPESQKAVKAQEVTSILRFSPEQVVSINDRDRSSSQFHVQHLDKIDKSSEFDHGLLAFKDAPGLRGQPSGLDLEASKDNSHKQPNTGSLHEPSLSDQNEDDRLNVQDGPQRDKNSIDLEKDITNSSRPALEMSMYILLGLFALVGLVFAVNCGAAVPRYRWERSSRRRLHQSAHSEQANTSIVRLPVTPEKSSREYGDVHSDAERNLVADQNSDESMFERCKRLIWQHRSKHKPVLHRDNNWVWVSRDKAAVAIGTSDQSTSAAGGPIVPNSPTPPASVKRMKNSKVGEIEQRKVARSHSYGNQRGVTTAVLSIGEADMLLSHSPYHKKAWKDSPDRIGIRSIENDHRSPYDTPNTLLPSHLTRKLWKTEEYQPMEQITTQTLGRAERRHTTGTLMQRNYPGHECSIRIISNPLSGQSIDYSSQSPERNNSEREYRNTNNQDESETPFLLYDPSRAVQGCASASMRRRHVRDATHSRQLPTVPLLINGQLHPAVGHLQNANFVDNRALLFPQLIPPQILTDFNRDAAMFEAMMSRSWVRPKSTNEPFIAHPDYPESINRYTQYIASPIWGSRPIHLEHFKGTQPFNQPSALQSEITNSFVNRRNTKELDELHESKELGFIRNPSESAEVAPYPPVRTSSKSANHKTLETRGETRKHQSEIKHRPLSLPQSFHVSNELYSILAGNTTSTSASALLDSHAQLNLAESQRPMKANPSEESLWWYHPVRQPRRRKRNHEGKAFNTRAHNPGTAKRDGSSRTRSWETIEYACPASCDCDIYNQNLEFLRGYHEQKSHRKESRAPVGQGNLSSVSDLAWDKELLALSHDRLVAYFAGMKESTA